MDQSATNTLYWTGQDYSFLPLTRVRDLGKHIETQYLGHLSSIHPVSILQNICPARNWSPEKLIDRWPCHSFASGSRVVQSVPRKRRGDKQSRSEAEEESIRPSPWEMTEEETGRVEDQRTRLQTFKTDSTAEDERRDRQPFNCPYGA